ncbi:hypothetical protein [Clostridium senegalense]|uniref:hypothetical protein n=1 Tax=Clostridium senegalense TaxID=1465809 RepID=UPI001C1259D1|nr:hypothetical protein [Clostridium senegalense]MBU5227823.1 hypothetical protein [Clostridium senegalense]
MGIWIRSQKKTYLGRYIEVAAVGKLIIGYTGSTDTELGCYETEERTLEILNNIQRFIINGIRKDFIRNGDRITQDAVFYMPIE